MRATQRVAVLGAGLQGVCIALELARRGVTVDLVEQDARPLNRASLRNEGKIHLGLVYAKDATRATAETMLDGALDFRRLLSGWTAGRFDAVARSRPFVYVVARDTLLPPPVLAEHYAAVAASYRARLAADPGLDYLGTRTDDVWRRLEEPAFAALGAPAQAIAAFETIEAAIDLVAMADLLRRTVAAEPRIRFHPRRRVTAVTQTAGGYEVEAAHADGAWRVDADQVVNALWDGRLPIDAELGLRPPAAWSHRLKYRLLVDLPPALRARPSVTLVLGAYGDVVVHPDGRGYVSWYPECLQGWSADLAPPADWDGPCRGDVAAPDAAALARRALAAMDPWFPGIAAARPTTVDAGVIFALGDTDIVDPASRLHRRDRIGVESVDGYHSVNTGKLTTAPFFALAAADAVCGVPARSGRAAPPPSDLP